MCDMIDRYPGHSKTLFIADRGYENYNIFAHVQENGMFYLIRAKDITSNGIVSSLKNHLPDDQESFDTSVSIACVNSCSQNFPVRWKSAMVRVTCPAPGSRTGV